VLTKIAPLAGVPVREQTVRTADFAQMQECFLLSTTRDVAPVAAIDETLFKVGGGTVAARLKVAFSDYARAEAKAHPELCV
jgi:branched-chain amino acid aminotransferase